MINVQIKLSEATAAKRRVSVWLVDGTDGITARTGQTGVVRISKNGGASADTAASLTEVDSTNMPGLYYIELSAAEVNTVGPLYLSYKAASTARWHETVAVISYDPYDAVALGLTDLDATISSRASAANLATVQADTDDIQTRLPAALVSGRMDSSVGAVAANAITAAAIADGAIDAATFAVGALDAAALAADAGTEIAAAVWAAAARTLTATLDPTAAVIMAAIWDELTANARTAGSFGALIKTDIDATISSRASAA